MNPLDQLNAGYRAILCDIWGVVHDGDRVLPGVEQRLLQWKGEGRKVILVTNAPRSADTVQRYLDWLGLPRQAYDAITSSGEAGIAALTDPGRPVIPCRTRAPQGPPGAENGSAPGITGPGAGIPPP